VHRGSSGPRLGQPSITKYTLAQSGRQLPQFRYEIRVLEHKPGRLQCDFFQTSRPHNPQMEVRMLQITVTVSAEQEKVIEEARRLEREGIAKIHEHTPTLILNVPDHRNEEKVIVELAKLARKGLVTDFRSSWVK
jgi:hypothetical protein